MEILIPTIFSSTYFTFFCFVFLLLTVDCLLLRYVVPWIRIIYSFSFSFFFVVAALLLIDCFFFLDFLLD
ncbi:hypothetical protein BZA77DRAFT_323786 [Pyronema omphalodes]|nr:hypothetical protein BZA77DRAFT_323786 [Pyronema omphalodes]